MKKKLLALPLRLVPAAVFLFSGFVKLVDPIGMANKFSAYTAAVGVRLDDVWLQIGAIILAVFEFLLGVYLFLGVRRRFTAPTVTLFMGVMTLLTIWIFVANPVPDCGCFGEAVTLSHGWTLLKNIVLLAMAVALWRFRDAWRMKFMTERHAWMTCIYSLVYAVVLSLYAQHFLPPLDFSAYKQGADIRAALNGEGSPEDSEALANFYLYDADTGDDVSLEVLEKQGATFLLTVPRPSTADDGVADRINDLYDYCADHHIAFYLATAGSEDDITRWRERTGATYPVLQAEDTELRAMVRADVGLMLITDGRVAGKWSKNNLPEITDEELSDPSRVHDFRPAAHFLSPLSRLLLYLLAPIALMILSNNVYVGWKFRKLHRLNA